MEKKYNGAIFDMDGLLFDTERVYQEIWQELAAERGVELGSDFPGEISGTTGDLAFGIIERYYHSNDGKAIWEECMRRIRGRLSESVPMKKGVHEILEYFRGKGIRTAVASSSAAEQIESNLEMAGIRAYFSEVVSGREVRLGKPAPDIFLLAAERIHCVPGECIVFEDSINGIKAGHAAGCATVMVPDLVAPTPEILPCCTMICSDLTEAVRKIREKDYLEEKHA